MLRSELNQKLHAEEQTVRSLRNKLADLKESGNQEKLETTEEALLATKRSKFAKEVEFLKYKLADKKKRG